MRTWEDYKLTAQGEDSVFDYVRQGQIQNVLLYLAKHGDPDLVNHKGHSLLMLAAYNGHLSLVHLLLRYGANPNSRDHGGSTILMGVAFKGHNKIAQVLINAGADIHAKNNNGQTALMYAEAFGRKDMALMLTETSPHLRFKGPSAFRRLKAVFQLLQSPFTNKGVLHHE
ncbi:hypothetical protein AZI87_10435 [Bdellovibrio bacteriovorus]|uniref:Uncharacterized protein n=1 Tax=Bdellovibrio bacteriovorus TaxID=959 RepID=A0A162H3I1_BDEBC|nr:ankyrin repeat domain-containing protein [Bdellovibrio bacteriovorus]KYG69580.1 hypothetical protein AZI87_10435 [Bdellovibrio bacteriovorus]